jgi:hypothetical protein
MNRAETVPIPFFFRLGSQVVGLEIKMDTSLSKSESKWSSPAAVMHPGQDSKLPRILRVLCSMHLEDVRSYDYVNYIVPALHQLHRALRLLATRPHGSTSTLPCAASTRLSAAAALHRLRRTPPRRRLLGVRLPRLLISTSFNSKTSRGRLPRHQQLVRIHLQLVDFSSNHHGSITDRHGFVDTRPRIKLSHLFQ